MQLLGDVYMLAVTITPMLLGSQTNREKRKWRCRIYMLFLANLSLLWPGLLCWGCLQSSGDGGETQQLQRNALAVETAE